MLSVVLRDTGHPPLGLWVSGRVMEHASRLRRYDTLYLCYTASLFFPVTGPRYEFPLAQNAATHVLPARATQWLLDMGDSWGTAFPSSHVAASIVAALCALRFWRPLGLALVPPTIGLTFAVVYGQFHYGVDAISGIVVAIAVWMSLNGRRRDRAAALHPAADCAVIVPEPVAPPATRRFQVPSHARHLR